jgi:hypothetical protein
MDEMHIAHTAHFYVFQRLAAMGISLFITSVSYPLLNIRYFLKSFSKQGQDRSVGTPQQLNLVDLYTSKMIKGFPDFNQKDCAMITCILSLPLHIFCSFLTSVPDP